MTARPEAPWYLAMLLVSQPLHFGDYGGRALKILWALLDLMAITILVSGVVLWLRKARGSSRYARVEHAHLRRGMV